MHWLRVYGPPVLGWIFVAVRLALPGRHLRDPERRVTFIVLCGSAMSMTVLTPAVYSTIGRLAGVPNIARLLGHVIMLLVCREVQTYLLRLNNPSDARRRSRRDAIRLAGVLALLTITFALADTPVDAPRFAGRYASTPWVLEYWLVLLCYVAPAFYNMIQLGLRHANETDKPAVRVGLHLMVGGVVCALVYHLHKAVFFATQRFGLGYPAGTRAMLDIMAPFAAAVLVLVGATTPIWWAWLRVPALLDWVHRYRVYQDLRPLWRDLYQANPPMAFSPRRSTLVDLFDPRDLRLRLYRRIIEIRDWRLTLRRYVDPRESTIARNEAARRGASGQKLEAEVEAATLAAALRAHNLGRQANRRSGRATIPGGSDLESDTTFLVNVARAYRQVHGRASHRHRADRKGRIGRQVQSGR